MHQQRQPEPREAVSPVRVYLASSWKNFAYPLVLFLLKRIGCDVYDFRNPIGWEGGRGVSSKPFKWEDLDPGWQDWSPDEYRKALQSKDAQSGYLRNREAIEGCDVCLLVLPAGRSASWELGYAQALAKRTAILSMTKENPDLMFGGAEFLTSTHDLFDYFGYAMHESPVTAENQPSRGQLIYDASKLVEK